MSKGEVSPPVAENQPHDPRSEMNVFFALRPVHVFLLDIAQIMKKEGCAEPRIPRKPIEGPPTDSNEKWMDKDAVRSEENAFCDHSHRVCLLSVTCPGLTSGAYECFDAERQGLGPYQAPCRQQKPYGT